MFSKPGRRNPVNKVPSMITTRRASVLFCIGILTAFAPSWALDLDSIHKHVQENFDRIESLHVVLRCWDPNKSPDPEEIHTYDIEWAFTADGWIRLTTSEISPVTENGDRIPFAYQWTFNGDEARWVQINEGEQEAGRIFGGDGRNRLESFVQRTNLSSIYAPAMGWGGMFEKGLVDWLGHADAVIAGKKQIDGESRIVVEAPHENYLLRFHLSPSHGYALVRYELQRVAVYDVEELEEVKPDLWLPVRGTRTTKLDWPRPEMRPIRFKVEKLEVNAELSPELFETEFEEGLPVTDYRSNERVEWGTRVVEALPEARGRSSRRGSAVGREAARRYVAHGVLQGARAVD